MGWTVTAVRNRVVAASAGLAGRRCNKVRHISNPDLLPMPGDNPFTFGAMITDPDRFIGRRAELEIITARLNGNQLLLTRNLVEEADGGIRGEIEMVRRWWENREFVKPP